MILGPDGKPAGGRANIGFSFDTGHTAKGMVLLRLRPSRPPVTPEEAQVVATMMQRGMTHGHEIPVDFAMALANGLTAACHEATKILAKAEREAKSKRNGTNTKLQIVSATPEPSEEPEIIRPG